MADIVPGKIICIEGGDGAGKETQSRLIIKWLEELGIQAEYVSYPRYENPEAGPILNFLKGDFGSILEYDPYLVTTLYAHDRWKDSPRIKLLIAKGKWILFDRYSYSSMAYQPLKVVGEHAVKKLIEFIHYYEFIHLKIYSPDVVIYLKTDQVTRQARIQARGCDDEYEKSDSIQKSVDDMYDQLSILYDFSVVEFNGRSAEEIHKDIRFILKEKLNL